MPLPGPRLYSAGTATAVAPVAAIPTTAAQYVLWNGEPVGGKTYTITSMGFTTIASAAAAFVGQLLAHVVPGIVVAAPTGGTAAKGPVPMDGQTSTSRALSVSAVTLGAAPAAAGMWHPVGMSVNGGAATATIGMGSYQLVRGMYILPPGGLLSLAVFCSAAGSATCSCFVTWEEAQL